MLHYDRWRGFLELSCFFFWPRYRWPFTNTHFLSVGFSPLLGEALDRNYSLSFFFPGTPCFTSTEIFRWCPDEHSIPKERNLRSWAGKKESAANIVSQPKLLSTSGISPERDELCKGRTCTVAKKFSPPTSSTSSVDLDRRRSRDAHACLAALFSPMRLVRRSKSRVSPSNVCASLSRSICPTTSTFSFVPNV